MHHLCLCLIIQIPLLHLFVNAPPHTIILSVVLVRHLANEVEALLQLGRRPPNNTPRSDPCITSHNTSVQCQIISKKRGHEALKCWLQFDNNYQDTHAPEALAAPCFCRNRAYYR